MVHVRTEGMRHQHRNAVRRVRRGWAREEASADTGTKHHFSAGVVGKGTEWGAGNSKVILFLLLLKVFYKE